MKIGKTVRSAIFLVLLSLAILPLVIYAQPLTKNFLAAVDLAGQGIFPEARKIFQEILAAEPTHERARRCLQVIEDLERKKIGSRTASHLFKGLSYSYKGKLQKALAEANLALKLKPDWERAYNARGGFYFELGRIDLALADYNRALQLDPQYAGVYYNRGCLYLKTEQYERAIADFDRALKLDPQFAGPRYNRGIAHFNKGEFLWALADFNRALEINPHLAEAHFNRAVVLEELGKEQEAAEAYKKFLQSAAPTSSREIGYARKRLEALGK